MRPSRISREATNCAVLLGIAKQMPCAGRMIAVLTPITSPRRVDQRSAGVAGIERRVGLDDVVDQPPGARAERAAERAHDARRSRCSGSRTGCRSRPRAGPTWSVDESPSSARDQVASRVDAITARSVSGSSPTRSAAKLPAVGERRRRCASAPWTTWLLVRIEPVRREDEARAAATLRCARLWAALSSGTILADLDVHDRGAHRLDRGDHGLGVGVEENGVGGWLGLGCSKGIVHGAELR